MPEQGGHRAKAVDGDRLSVECIHCCRSAYQNWSASPPPSWGRDREGGIAEHLPSGSPPPLTPPHKGEGNPVAVLDPDMFDTLPPALGALPPLLAAHRRFLDPQIELAHVLVLDQPGAGALEHDAPDFQHIAVVGRFE